MANRDALRTLSDERDRAFNTAKRLRLLPRNGGAVRRVCASCWHVVDEQAEFKAWLARLEADCGCASRVDARAYWAGFHKAGAGWEHWSKDHWVFHRFPLPITVCPKCGTALHEVEL